MSQGPDIPSLKAKAEFGDALAQCELGVAYEKGLGVEQDQAEAMKWFWLAARQGAATAQWSLGDVYAMKKDWEKAYFWLSLAAKENKLFEGDKIAAGKQLNSEQNTAIDKRVGEWKPRPPEKYCDLEKRLLLVLNEMKQQKAIGDQYPKDTLQFAEHMEQLREWIEVNEGGIAYEDIVGTLESFPFMLSGKAAIALLEVGLFLGFKTQRQEDSLFDRRKE